MYVCFYFYLSRCLDVHPSEFLSVSVWISVSVSVCPMSGCMDVCVSVLMSPSLFEYGLSVLLSECVSVRILVCLDVYLSWCLSGCLDICMSVWVSVCMDVNLDVCMSGCSVFLDVWMYGCLRRYLYGYPDVLTFACLSV